MKSKVAAILLLVSLTGPLAGTYLWLLHKKATVRRRVMQEMAQGIGSKSLITIKLTKDSQNKITWKEDHEFEYRGDMYDVVGSRKQGDTTYYECWPDHQETLLNQQLARLVTRAANHNNQHKKDQEQLMNFYKSLCGCPIYQMSFIRNSMHQPLANRYIFSYSIFSTSPPAPPPKIS